ncbi:uncharacterized protein LOC142163020 [Nicotiana tabacum]|uniref:Uncharacterized protein LOC142163020 n=1 Tax=Nicotiana tabacum TaxID=4097 RepID=A0AC58RUG4_TOBAC
MGNLPIPLKKDENGQVIVSTDPLDLDAKAKNLVYNAISGEAYENISSFETAKEVWDKLEATFEGTKKVKETRINILVREYELFQMKNGESVEKIFSKFSNGDLKSFGIPIKRGEQVRKILSSLPTIWQPRIIALECHDLDKISYDEFKGDLIAFYKTHLDRQIQQEKKKIVAFKATVAELENEEEEEGGEQDENIAMLSQVLTSMMRKNKNSRRSKSNFRKGRMNNDNDKNDGTCYECGKHGHIQDESPELSKETQQELSKEEIL